MKINILRIRNTSGEKLSFNINKQLETIEVNGQEYKFDGPVEVEGEIVNQVTHFLLTGLAKANLITSCVNCLEPFELTVQGKLEENYVKHEDIKAGLGEEMIDFTGDIIDIEPEVVKSLIMELPMRLICSEACRGLCSQCGANLNLNQCVCQDDNLDPRLAILKKFKQ